MEFEDKVIVITGAASGIGRSCVNLFEEQGAIVIACDHNEEGLLSLCSKRIQTYILHVENEKEWESVISKVIQSYKHIDVLVNCAGISSRDIVTEGTFELWHQIIDVNAFGPYLGMKYCIPHMQNQKKGSIINITSVGAIVGIGGGTVYPASKGAVYSMTRRIAAMFGIYNIRANMVCPGWIKTDMTKDARKEKEQQFIERQALKQIGDPIDVAQAVVFLASDKAKFITGTEVIVDGGFTTT